MNRYRPFEKERKSKKAPVVWACGLGLFAVVLFFALILVEEHLVFTKEGLFFDFEKRETSKKVEPGFVMVPELVVESEPESESEVGTEEDTNCYPTSFAEGSIYAAAFDLDVMAEEVSQYPVNTVILTLRDGTGVVSYRSSIGAVSAHSTGDPVDLEAKLAELHAAGYKVFARISVFADAAFASDNPESALKSISQSTWVDQKGNTWANPYSQVFNDYFDSLLEEYASFDFDGYLFENACFPYDANEKDCLYVEDSTEERAREVEDTVDAIHSCIRSKPVWLLLDIPSILTEGTNSSTGVNTDVLNEKGIGIAPLMTVSSSGNLAYQLKEQNYCTALDYETLTAAYPEGREGTPLPLPVVEQKGEVTGSFADSFTVTYLELRKASPGRTALVLGDTNYNQAMLALQEEDEPYLVRGIHERPPEPEPVTEPEGEAPPEGDAETPEGEENADGGTQDTETENREQMIP